MRNTKMKLSDNEFEYLTSLTKAQFNELYEYCDPIPVQGGSRYIKKNIS